MLDGGSGTTDMGWASACARPLRAQVLDELEDVEAQLGISRCCASSMPQTSTCTCSASVGKKALISSPMVKSGKSRAQRSRDGVVVGERHVGHAARLGLAVDEVRVGEHTRTCRRFAPDSSSERAEKRE